MTRWLDGVARRGGVCAQPGTAAAVHGRKGAWGIPEVLTLGDGRSVIVRPARPQDARALGAFIERGLSPASRRRRFHCAIRSLPPRHLAALTQVDQIAHVALVAESVEADLAADGSTTVLVAEARYVVEASGFQAEIALAVADAWQRMGLGTVLLNHLSRLARLRGLLGFRADVMIDNTVVLEALRKRGSCVRPHPDDATLRRLWVPTGLGARCAATRMASKTRPCSRDWGACGSTCRQIAATCD
jgi:acetyltransferase